MICTFKSVHEPEFFSIGSQERNKNLTWRITTCQIVLLLDFQTNMFLEINNNNFLLLCMSTAQKPIHKTLLFSYGFLENHKPGACEPWTIFITEWVGYGSRKNYLLDGGRFLLFFEWRVIMLWRYSLFFWCFEIDEYKLSYITNG